ncbi:MAG TPA: hypothetical protein VKU41_17300, partial [Polyangiaceae bacterium]|nr:hypothetical protein [Polyangiaceae bacterium]
LFAAGLIAGLRLQGLRGPLSVRMGGALLFVVFLATLSSIVGGAGTDNASHLGGAIAGVVIALAWRLPRTSSRRVVGVTLAACVGALLACVGAVAWRDSRDPFTPLTMQARFDFTAAALAEGRCADAFDGLRAVERLRGGMAPATSLRAQVSAMCGNGATPLDAR